MSSSSFKPGESWRDAMRAVPVKAHYQAWDGAAADLVRVTWHTFPIDHFDVPAFHAVAAEIALSIKFKPGRQERDALRFVSQTAFSIIWDDPEVKVSKEVSDTFLNTVSMRTELNAVEAEINRT